MRTSGNVFATNCRVEMSLPTLFGFDPGSGSKLEQEKVSDAPDPIGEPSGHSGSRGRAEMLGGTQLIMRDTPVVHTADQIHPRFKGFQTVSGVSAAARQGGQTLPEGRIEPFNKGG